MKLQQLRYLAAVVQNDLNITAAAAKLRATQSAISKQLKLLEEELGFDVFMRSGRTLTRVTSPGERVIRHALKMLREAENIHGLSEDLREDVRGSLSIGTTHTQARYVLPPIIQKFRLRYPNVQFHLHQGTSEQIAAMAEVEEDSMTLRAAVGARGGEPPVIRAQSAGPVNDPPAIATAVFTKLAAQGVQKLLHGE